MSESDPNVYAIVEIMGRRTRAGAIADAQLGGQTLLRIQHPARMDHTGTEPLVEYYAPSAIFAVRPCSQAEAEAVANWAWAASRTQPSLPAAAEGFIDVDGDDYEDEDEDDDRAYV